MVMAKTCDVKGTTQGSSTNSSELEFWLRRQQVHRFAEPGLALTGGGGIDLSGQVMFHFCRERNGQQQFLEPGDGLRSAGAAVTLQQCRECPAGEARLLVVEEASGEVRAGQQGDPRGDIRSYFALDEHTGGVSILHGAGAWMPVLGH